MIKNLPAKQEVQETRIQYLGQEDPLEGEMATHSSILTMDREAWQATVHGIANSRTRCSNSTATTRELKGVKEPVLDGVVKARPWCRGDIRTEN